MPSDKSMPSDESMPSDKGMPSEKGMPSDKGMPLDKGMPSYKSGATGPVIRVRWEEYHAGNAGESRLAVGCRLDGPLPICAKMLDRQLHHQSGGISGN